jgi:hypothetical protein
MGNGATDDHSDASIKIQEAFGILLSNHLALRLPEKSSKTPPAIAYVYSISLNTIKPWRKKLLT